jgi:hypothetical protein
MQHLGDLKYIKAKHRLTLTSIRSFMREKKLKISEPETNKSTGRSA